MIRTLFIAATATLLLGAAPPPATVDYRLGVEPHAGQPPMLTVEIRLRGDDDGQTRLRLPDNFASATEVWRYVSDFDVKGASVAEDGPAVRALTHRPGAKLTVRYRLRTAYDQDPAGADGNPYRGPIIRPDWFALMGNFGFATPEGRSGDPATFRWSKMPKGWRAASDLEHGAMGRWMTVQDVRDSIVLGGPRLALAQRPIAGGQLRVAGFEGSAYPPEASADDIAKVVSGQRGFWNDLQEPYFVALLPLTPRPQGTSSGGTGRGDGFVLYATPGAGDRLRWTIAHEHIHTWIPRRIATPQGRDEAATYWFTEGFTDFFTHRTLLRAGLASPEDIVGRMDAGLKAYDASPLKTAPNARIVADFWKERAAKDLPYQRGALLALKWDEDIRRKTGGKADLDDVILRMRDHYRQFPPGQGPDVVTGLVSATWVVAQIDLRPDIARHVDRGEAITLPEIMFDGCLDARVNVSPGFDSGFDHAASAPAKVVKGVKRRGPAWNSGLRDGMRLDAIDLRPGDMSREIVLTVRPANGRGKARTLRYWPYGDADVQTRTLQLAFGLEGEKLAACGRKIAGL